MSTGQRRKGRQATLPDPWEDMTGGEQVRWWSEFLTLERWPEANTPDYDALDREGMKSAEWDEFMRFAWRLMTYAPNIAPGNERLSDEVGVSTRKVSKYLRSLVALGFLELARAKSRTTPAGYRLALPDRIKARSEGAMELVPAADPWLVPPMGRGNGLPQTYGEPPF